MSSTACYQDLLTCACKKGRYSQTYVCRSKTEYFMRDLKQWKGMDVKNGQFVWLMANTPNERTWMVQKQAASLEHEAVPAGA